MASLPRKNYARIPVKLDLPNLIDIQLDSFARLKKKASATCSMKSRRSNRITKE